MTSRKSTSKVSHSAEYGERDGVRECFLAAGRRLFAQKGFDGVSIKDLAAAAGYNGALVSYHFKNKEGLYRECVLPLVGAGLTNMERTLRAPHSRQDFITRFELFVEDFVATHLQHEDLCIILKRDMNTAVVKKLYKEHFALLGKTLHTFFRSAKRGKLLRADLDTEIATHFVMSCMFQLITTDRFRAEVGECCFFTFSRRSATIRQVTRCLLYGLSAPEA